jgi:hypothetical protein
MYIQLHKCIHPESAYEYSGHICIHEHDLRLDQMRIVDDKQFLMCSTCNILYCEKCGKEVSTPHSDFDAIEASLQ